MDCNQPTILIAEDDPPTRRFLADNLIADGFDIVETGSVAGALATLTRERPALAVVDLGLPDGDGLELIRTIRETDPLAGRLDAEVPLIVLSGRAGEADRVRALSRGADDFLPKPFSALELAARIRAVLRRRERRPAGARLRVGPLELDVLARQAWLGGAAMQLTGKEFALLRTLASEPTRVFTRDELLETIWGYQSLVPSRTVDSHVCRLRHKLTEAGATFVINVWGVGYRLIDATPR